MNLRVLPSGSLESWLGMGFVFDARLLGLPGGATRVGRTLG